MSKTTTKLETSLNALMLGFQQGALPSSVKSLSVGGATLTPSQIMQRLQGYLAAYGKVRTARTAYQDAVEARKAGEPGASQLAKDLKSAIEQLLGRNASLLAPFGITLPSKPRKPSVMTQAVGQAKRKAKREQKKQLDAQLNPQGSFVILGPDGTPVAGSAPVPPSTGAVAK
jgi:hypothetical protein